MINEKLYKKASDEYCYAFLKVGIMMTPENQKNFDPDEVKAFYEALAEYQERRDREAE